MAVMENIREFVDAALPWVAMGLAVAVFAARNGENKK